MANLKADSPICRRIVLSILDFLHSVEPSSVSDVESLEVAKDCLSEAFKIDSLSTASVPISDTLVQIFSSQPGENNEIKSDQVLEKCQADTSHPSSTINAPVDPNIPGPSQTLGDTDKQDNHTIGVSEDELFGQFFGALEKVRYFGTTPNGDEEQALDRATNLFHTALTEMKQSGGAEFNLKNLADTFKLQGNKAMQAKLYPDAIELYSIAIALVDDNAVYYCNRAAAYTQANQYTEAIRDCNKAIEVDPNYSKAYSRLGFAYYAQGRYKDAIKKGFRKALQLDPNNESIKGNIQAAEEKLREQRQRGGRRQGSTSFSFGNGGLRGRGPIPNFTGFPTNMTESFNMSDIMRGVHSAGPSNSNNHDGEPEIRVGVGGADQLPEEVYGALRSAFQMFSDGNGNGNGNGTHDNSSEN
ncbi:uncharacterized protein [Rutidosis leptorrhynchoides]|uniref:uncharacterized protein n=1 Tax=Rutidosis leptorrhynchoides TaxID=125765 RepID=UPI003A99C79A